VHVRLFRGQSLPILPGSGEPGYEGKFRDAPDLLPTIIYGGTLK
jgi:hypothetical protein